MSSNLDPKNGIDSQSHTEGARRRIVEMSSCKGSERSQIASGPMSNGPVEDKKHSSASYCCHNTRINIGIDAYYVWWTN